MKLQWDAHLHQIEVNHITWMLALSWLKVFTWEAIFTKARQIYSAVVRSEIAFKASVWYQWEKEKELLNKECRLETLQNQSRNVHKLAACSSEHAAKQDHVTQLSQWSYTENQISMQIDMRSSDECQLHHLSLFYHQESDASEQLNSRRCENTVKTQAINFRCNDFN